MTVTTAPDRTIGTAPAGFWTDRLSEADPEVHAAVRGELKRQQDKIELIASENIASRAVLEAAARSSPTNMPKAIRASAITAAANMPMWWRTWR